MLQNVNYTLKRFPRGYQRMKPTSKCQSMIVAYVSIF